MKPKALKWTLLLLAGAALVWLVFRQRAHVPVAAPLSVNAPAAAQQPSVGARASEAATPVATPSPHETAPQDAELLEEAQSVAEMRALVEQGRIGQARSLAMDFFRKHPESRRREEVARLLGVRPRTSADPRTPVR